MVKKALNLTLLAGLLFSGLGCGGSDSSSGASSRGKVSFSVTWPAEGRFLAKNANKVVVHILNPDATDATPPLVFYRMPPPGETNYSNTQVTPGLAAGNYTVNADSYSSTTTGAGVGTENPLSSGTQPVTVNQGSTSPVTLTLASTLTEVQVDIATLALPAVILASKTISVDDPTAGGTPIPLLTGVAYKMYVTPHSPVGNLVLFNTGFFSYEAENSQVTVDVPAGSDVDDNASARHSRTIRAVTATPGSSTATVRVNYADNKFDNTPGSQTVRFRTLFTVGP